MVVRAIGNDDQARLALFDQRSQSLLVPREQGAESRAVNPQRVDNQARLLGFHDNADGDIFVDVMTEFVREDRFDFVGAEFAQQCIAQHDAARVAQAHQRRVGCFGAAAHIKLVHAAHFSVCLLGQSHQACGEIRVFVAQRYDLVKDWHDQDRIEICQHDRKQQHDRSSPEPPCVGRSAQHGVDHLDHDEAEHTADDHIFDAITDPAADRLGGQLEAMRQHKAGVVGQRQIDDGHACRKYKRHAGHQKPIGCGDGR